MNNKTESFPQNISTLLIESFIDCPTKCFLYSMGHPRTGNAYSQWIQSSSAEYLNNQIENLKNNCAVDKILVKPSIKDLLTSDWNFAFNFIATTPQLTAEIQAIEHVQLSKRGIQPQITPLRFAFTNKINKKDKIILCFEAFVLSALLDRTIEYGKLIHGDNGNTIKIKVSAMLGTVKKLIGQINTLLSSVEAPELILNRHCDECVFKLYCRQKAMEKNDLTLLSGISDKERKKYNSKGIFTVTQLSYTFKPRRRSKRFKDKREKYHYSLKALAIREQKIHVIGDIELKLVGTPVFVDVEGLPDKDFYYLIGIRVEENKSVMQYNLWANTQEDEQKIWDEFLEVINKIEKPVIIHYGSYESTFFRKMYNRYRKPVEGSPAAKAISSSINLLSVIYAQIYFPTYSNGLKEIAAYLGFQWSEINASGLLSIVWRNQWQSNLFEKDKLIQYNSQDCEALSLITQFVLQLATNIGSKATDMLNVIHADSMTSKMNSKWRKFASPVADFEHINSTAHWDYQRERVFVRTGSFRRKNVKPLVLRNKKMHIDKTIKWKEQPQCPNCSKNYRKKGKVIYRTLQDVIFSRFGIKRRIVRYIFQTYACRNCKTVYGIPEKYTIFRKYGWNMISYFFYQIIELSIPQLTVIKHFNRIFGYGIPHSSVNNIKTSIAAYYAETKEAIINRIINGPLVHADETMANIKGISAYVWVLTSMNYVVYIFAETREGELIQKQLSNFKGVLVSDFYAAYDSINCPQQKCLIHLMRDLNDDILNNPFDEQLKHIASKFAEVLKPMVETIDRYGLKSYFLRKHLIHAERFFTEIIDVDYSSEAAIKYKQRFEKNRDKLFTFLNYDGIPWNNNNAEHAIKAFAALRDVIAGSSTAKGLDSYLVLLSICQTCKYQGLDFLDFMRSGEKDIEAFAASKRIKGLKRERGSKKPFFSEFNSHTIPF